jgi:YegS/Rv2252/BmrU family lipid kinase
MTTMSEAKRRDRIGKADLQQKIRRHKRAALIVNTHSRKGGKLYPEAKRQLEAHGFKLVASYAVKHPKRLNETIAKALSYKPDLLVVGSGDGTVSEVVDHLAFADTALGYIPLGTTNNFARSVGIPLDVAGAIDTIVNGQVNDIDLGVAAKPDNGEKDYFANVASIGLSVEVAANVPHKLKRKVGRIAYVLTGLRVMLSHRPFKARITANGRTRSIRTHQLVIANGRSHGGRVIARDVDIDNKQLTIFRLGRKGRWELVKSLVRFSLHQNRSTSEKNYLTTPLATVATDPVCAIEIDGEIKSHTPATFSIAPDALYVMVPKPAKQQHTLVK